MGIGGHGAEAFIQVVIIRDSDQTRIPRERVSAGQLVALGETLVHLDLQSSIAGENPRQSVLDRAERALGIGVCALRAGAGWDHRVASCAGDSAGGGAQRIVAESIPAIEVGEKQLEGPESY